MPSNPTAVFNYASAAEAANKTIPSFAVVAGTKLCFFVAAWNDDNTTAFDFSVSSQTHSGSWTWRRSEQQSLAVAGDNIVIAFFEADVPASSSGTLTVAASAQTPGWWLAEGFSLTDVKAGAVKQAFKNSGGSVSGTTLSIALSGLGIGTSLYGGVYDGWGTSGVTHGTDWTEYQDRVSAEQLGLQTQYRHTSASACDWSGLNSGGQGTGFVGICVEIDTAGQPAVKRFGGTPYMRLNSGVWAPVRD